MPEMTATQRLVDHMLGGNLREYVLSRRAKGDSWRRISNALRDDTGEDVTYETLRSWYFADDEADAVAGDAA
jgi:hypothetical protein